jgi:hypothetical protein
LKLCAGVGSCEGWFPFIFEVIAFLSCPNPLLIDEVLNPLGLSAGTAGGSVALLLKPISKMFFRGLAGIAGACVESDEAAVFVLGGSAGLPGNGGGPLPLTFLTFGALTVGLKGTLEPTSASCADTFFSGRGGKLAGSYSGTLTLL